MTGARNVKGGIVLLCFGLAAGLVMSLYAFKPMVPVPEALARYDDLPRRLFRLSHIAAIMLPLINIVLGGWLDRLALSVRWRAVSSWLLLLGGIALPVTLAVEALCPTVIFLHLSAIPAVAFCAGAFVAGAGAVGMTFDEEVSHDGRRTGVRDRAAALQEGPRA